MPDYSQARRRAYKAEIGDAVQTGAIIDALNAIFDATPSIAPPPSFRRVLLKIDEIKSRHPKDADVS